MICAGQCKFKISVQTVTITKLDSGGFTPAYTHSYYTNGSILGLTGKEYFEAAQTQGSANYKIIVRRNSNTKTMSIKDRLVVSKSGVTRTFNILSIVPDARCRDLIIMAVLEMA